MTTNSATTTIAIDDANSTPDLAADSEEVKSTAIPYDIDVDQFSEAMKTALLNAQFDVADKLLSKYDYNVYFNDDDQKSMILDTTPELLAKILKFLSDNSINFTVYEFTVFELINTKSYAKLQIMIQTDYIEYNPSKFIAYAISVNDSATVDMFSRYVDNNENVIRVLDAVETKVYEKEDSKDKNESKDKYIEFKNTSSLLAFLNSEFVRELLDMDAMKIVINIATIIKDTSLYSFIIHHSLFSSTSNRVEEYNLVFCYIDRACLPFDMNPEMIQYLLESNVETSVIRKGLLSHMTTNHAEMPSVIYQVFLNDSRNILFDMINVPDSKVFSQIQTSTQVMDSLFFSDSSGYHYSPMGFDDFKKIRMTSDAFLMKLSKKSRCVLMSRVFEAYMRGDYSFSHLKYLLIDYYYSSLFELFSKAVNAYYNEQMQSFPNRIEPCDYKIFELFDVDSIERMIPFAPHFHGMMTQFPPEFTSTQIVFLHSKCKGKSKNSREFIKTLKTITGKDYTFADLIDFDSIFKFDDGRQIFNSIVMDYVGLQEVEVKPENRID
jgi:hypothetical protein